jgi:tripartite-type tricarboxylate transporter receptor subunit TctC
MTAVRFRGSIFALLLHAALSALFFANAANAETYPAKPVRIVVPFAAGSLSDGLARFLGDELGKSLATQFIVDNKPGASAIIGAETVAKAAPDGYTLLLTTNTPHSANPSLFKQLPYDPIKDFTPIERIGFFPFVLVVNASLPVKNVAELIAYDKDHPGKLNYATSNSMSLVSAETIKLMAKIDVTGVPYKSNPQALTDLVGGQVHMMVVDVGTSRTHLESGKLRALGVTPAAGTRLLPKVPPLAKAGLSNFDFIGWVGLVGPAKMPDDVVAKLHSALAKILARKDVQDRMDTIGCEAAAMPPKEFAAFIEQQLGFWAGKVKAAGIQPE